MQGYPRHVVFIDSVNWQLQGVECKVVEVGKALKDWRGEVARYAGKHANPHLKILKMIRKEQTAAILYLV